MLIKLIDNETVPAGQGQIAYATEVVKAVAAGADVAMTTSALLRFSLGGSFYYLAAGLGLIASGSLLIAAPPAALTAAAEKETGTIAKGRLTALAVSALNSPPSDAASRAW